MVKENIVVIEATSSGINYIPQIKRLGYNPVCVELYPGEENKEMQRILHDLQYSLVTDENPDILLADESYEKTLEKIKELNPILIVPGSDEGIIWANNMSYELGLPGNNPKILKKMMSKRCMQESLKKSNLRYIKSKVIKTFDEAKEFLSEVNSSKIVIKPSIGQASIGVCICKNDEEIANAIELNNRIDVLDNDEIIVQEYIGGDEYVVDSVSCNGVNRIVGGYKYNKLQIEGGSTIYDYVESIDASDPTFKKIMEYHKKVIPSIGIEYGAIHSEFKIDEKGPVLMEVNGRVHGGLEIYTIMEKAWGEDHSGAALEAYLDLDSFHEKLDKVLEIDHYYAVKDLIVPEECFVLESHVETVFKDLESFGIAIEFGGGRVYPKTVDLSTCGGMVHLINKSKSKLMEDIAYIKRVEKEEIEKMFTIKK